MKYNSKQIYLTQKWNPHRYYDSDLVRFYGISTIVGYLMANLFLYI